jgi:hypothetical protein
MALTKIQGGVVKNTTQLSINSINATGIITATTFFGDGSNITGVSGFATALSSSTTSPLNQIFKTSKTLSIGAGISISVEVNESDGSIAFTRASNIIVASGATFRIASGTEFRTNVLGVF